MERIIGINEARPKLTSLMDSLQDGAEPIIITVNSVPKSVLISYQEYYRLSKLEKENKRSALKLAIEKTRSRAEESGITENEIEQEINAARKWKRGKER